MAKNQINVNRSQLNALTAKQNPSKRVTVTGHCTCNPVGQLKSAQTGTTCSGNNFTGESLNEMRQSVGVAEFCQ